ncbi:MAG: 4-aminobutyrate--2-oxoglutarate transaminase [Terasakiella sp.]|uniref:4-aminobutyrate--2-oxoglutarate transaminase n=1 Tax=unclassified Terasakiella TaxID=2614952 RepID=UPI003B0033D9
MSLSSDLKDRRLKAIPQGVGNLTSIFTQRADNAELWDVEGKRYVDFASGIAVLNTGHCNPKVMAAAKEQMDRFTHTCFHVAMYDKYVELAEKLNEITPGDHAKKSMLVSTGAEAVENAIKIARSYTGRPGVIAFNGAFHGRTLLGMGLTGKVTPYKKGFAPFPTELYHAPFPGGYRGCDIEEAIAGLEELFRSDIDPGRVAAFIIEPVQGEGGFNPVPAEFMQALRKIADEHGILLICDEIQTGFARTGKMFATEYAGIIPDMMTLAKSLAGGFPLSAVVGRADVMDAVHPGGLGGTYAGFPPACAAALAAIEVIEEEKLCERAVALGDKIQGRFKAMAEGKFDCIGDVRGLGAMVAMELVKDRTAKTPDADLTKALLAEAEKRGLILLSCGTYGNVVRVLVPLTVSDAILEEGLNILEESLVAALS